MGADISQSNEGLDAITFIPKYNVLKLPDLGNIVFAWLGYSLVT